MVDAEQPFLPTARAYPDRVPLLVDHAAGILLRPTQESDLPAMVELARDSDTIRWTAVPTPDGGYRLVGRRRVRRGGVGGLADRSTARLGDRG